MAKINKDMVISDIIAIDRGVLPILMQAGMHCAGCPSAQTETLGEASFAHGQDVDELVEHINNYLESVE